MSLQAVPALELTSEEQEPAELDAITDDRMMAESNAAVSDSAQFPLSPGQHSAAGEGLLPLWQMLWLHKSCSSMMSWRSGQDRVAGERLCCADAKHFVKQ